MKSRLNLFDTPLRPAIALSQGVFLVSNPFFDDGYFNRTVVLLTENTVEGSVGFVINRPAGYLLHELMDNVPEHPSFWVGEGGPVGASTLHFLHHEGNDVPYAAHIVQSLYWGGDFASMRSMLREEKVLPLQVHFFLGYCGWSAGQLERELEESAWALLPFSDALLKLPFDQIWHIAIEQLGDAYKLWQLIPENPSLN